MNSALRSIGARKIAPSVYRACRSSCIERARPTTVAKASTVQMYAGNQSLGGPARAPCGEAEGEVEDDQHDQREDQARGQRLEGAPLQPKVLGRDGPRLARKKPDGGFITIRRGLLGRATILADRSTRARSSVAVGLGGAALIDDRAAIGQDDPAIGQLQALRPDCASPEARCGPRRATARARAFAQGRARRRGGRAR